MSTYQNIADYLSAVRGDDVPLTFQEIENIIGRRLPPSAYKHRPWWSNNASNSAMTSAWVSAGWKTGQVDMAAQRLVFTRTEKPTQHTAQHLALSIAHGETLQHLRQRARHTGKTLEATVLDIVEKHAKPNLQERLAMAAEKLGKKPNLSALDVPALIRDDRDRR
jgi:hypothetical protein